MIESTCSGLYKFITNMTFAVGITCAMIPFRIGLELSGPGLVLYAICLMFSLVLFYRSIKDSMKISVGNGLITIRYWLYPFYSKELNQRYYDGFYIEEGTVINQRGYKMKYKILWLVKDNILQERISGRTSSNFDVLLDALEIPFKGQLDNKYFTYKKGKEIKK